MIRKKRITIDNKEITYVDEGKGKTLLFLHGNPTSSYLWRNIIANLKNKYRCLAPDLIGMGDSDKLDSATEKNYSFKEHKKWLKGFIDGIKIKEKFFLVVHDWGSALGFDYLKLNEDAICGIVYMEAIVMPLMWNDWPENAKKIFKLIRSDLGENLILKQNLFIEKILPSSIIRKLTAEEMAEYRKPFIKEGPDRLPTLAWPRQIPLDKSPKDVCKLVEDYARFMRETNISKLFINAQPGSILIGRQRNFCRKWKNQKEVTVKGLHFIQEDSFNNISKEIDNWIETSFKF